MCRLDKRTPDDSARIRKSSALVTHLPSELVGRHLVKTCDEEWCRCPHRPVIGADLQGQSVRMLAASQVCFAEFVDGIVAYCKDMEDG